jgi:hypothetical protein
MQSTLLYCVYFEYHSSSSALVVSSFHTNYIIFENFEIFNPPPSKQRGSNINKFVKEIKNIWEYSGNILFLTEIN